MEDLQKQWKTPYLIFTKKSLFLTFFTFLSFSQIYQNHPISEKPKKTPFLLFSHTMTIIRFSSFLPNSQKWGKWEKCQNSKKLSFSKNGKIAKIGKMGKMGKMGGSAKIPKIGQIPKNGVFREIPQNWDFGDCGDEHTRKAWYDNYFQNNPWSSLNGCSYLQLFLTIL